jgi:membrane-associated protease RseP (regulator of RpoE activity)
VAGSPNNSLNFSLPGAFVLNIAGTQFRTNKVDEVVNIPGSSHNNLVDGLVQPPITPYLGVLVTPISEGAQIQQVQAGSPAAIAGLQVGDVIQKVSDQTVDATRTLDQVLAQFAVGQQVDFSFLRNGSSSILPVILAKLADPVLLTPSAEITVSDQTELLVDIGFNGVTGILVLADSALVREPVTGTEVDVPAGRAIIVVPGESIGTPFALTDAQVNKWWLNPQSSPETPAPQTYTGYKDFDPLPGVDEAGLFVGSFIVFGLIYLVVFCILIFKK